jgi:hypothetical protein
MIFSSEQLAYSVFNSQTITSTLTEFPLPPRSPMEHSRTLFVAYLVLSTASEGRSTKPESMDPPFGSFVVDVPWELLRCVSIGVAIQGPWATLRGSKK